MNDQEPWGMVETLPYNPRELQKGSRAYDWCRRCGKQTWQRVMDVSVRSEGGRTLAMRCEDPDHATGVAVGADHPVRFPVPERRAAGDSVVPPVAEASRRAAKAPEQGQAGLFDAKPTETAAKPQTKKPSRQRRR